MGSHSKGPSYERQIAKRLSEWWTGGASDAVLWRTSGSGGRATTRARQMKATAHQYGDLAATDPGAFDLLRFATFEIKKGYNAWTFQDFLDKPPPRADRKPGQLGAQQLYEEWVTKAKSCKRQAHSLYWMIVLRRDRRVPLVLFPSEILTDLEDHAPSSTLDDAVPLMNLTAEVTEKIGDGEVFSQLEMISCTTLDQFLLRVSPAHIREVVKAHAGDTVA